MASDQYTADTTQLQRSSATISSLAGQSRSVVSDLGSLVLDLLSFAQIGSPVGAASSSLHSGLTQALGKVSSLLSDIGHLVGTSAQNYSSADQQVAASLGDGASGSSGDGVQPLISSHHRGDRGADVLSLQQKLTAAGYDTGGTDGVWGAHTQAAVNAYLHDHPGTGSAGGGTATDPAGWTAHYTSPNSNPAVVGHIRLHGQQVPTYDMTGHEPPATAPGGNLNSWITDAKGVLQANGVDTSTMSDADLRTLIDHESSGQWNKLNNYDINARHGIPSKGLMQTIDQTFNTYSVPGHRDVWNPVDNIVAGVRYSIHRYGSFDQIPGVRAVNSGRPYVGY